MGTSVFTKTSSSTSTSNVNQQNYGDAFNISGIDNTKGTLTLTDHGAIDKAYELSKKWGDAIQDSLQAMSRLASDATDQGIAAARNQESAIAEQGRLAGYAKIAAAVAGVLLAGAVVVYLLKKVG